MHRWFLLCQRWAVVPRVPWILQMGAFAARKHWFLRLMAPSLRIWWFWRPACNHPQIWTWDAEQTPSSRTDHWSWWPVDHTAAHTLPCFELKHWVMMSVFCVMMSSVCVPKFQTCKPYLCEVRMMLLPSLTRLNTRSQRNLLACGSIPAVGSSWNHPKKLILCMHAL